MDVGKSAKRIGAANPKDVRKLDPVPPLAKLPGKASAKKPARKRYGYTHERFVGNPVNKWVKETHWQWYSTPKGRENAMKVAGGPWRRWNAIRNVQPIDR